MTTNDVRRPVALVDATILVSILVSPDSSRSAAAAIFERAELGQFTLVVSVEAIEETQRVASEKAWLVSHVEPAAVERLANALRRIAEVAPRLPEPAPRICRDPADDYLMAQGALARVAVLVTRDQELLAFEAFSGVRIVDPVTFLTLLRSAEA